jgi:hypothetical protein
MTAEIQLGIEMIPLLILSRVYLSSRRFHFHIRAARDDPAMQAPMWG